MLLGLGVKALGLGVVERGGFVEALHGLAVCFELAVVGLDRGVVLLDFAVVGFDQPVGFLVGETVENRCGGSGRRFGPGGGNGSKVGLFFDGFHTLFFGLLRDCFDSRRGEVVLFRFGKGFTHVRFGNGFVFVGFGNGFARLGGSRVFHIVVGEGGHRQQAEHQDQNKNHSDRFFHFYFLPVVFFVFWP